MSEIKVGDLVMCLWTLNPFHQKYYGAIRTVWQLIGNEFCLVPATIGMGQELTWDPRRLKKIDPPATGETREAYKNLKVPA